MIILTSLSDNIWSFVLNNLSVLFFFCSLCLPKYVYPLLSTKLVVFTIESEYSLEPRDYFKVERLIYNLIQ